MHYLHLILIIHLFLQIVLYLQERSCLARLLVMGLGLCQLLLEELLGVNPD